MKYKTSELTGMALDLAVALCEGGTDFRYDTIATYWITVDGKDRALSKGWAQSFTPSTEWSHGGPIIEKESIGLLPSRTAYYEREGGTFYSYGPTALIAAMRCYVASKLGDEIEIPDEVIQS